jgi:hypothetical protein
MCTESSCAQDTSPKRRALSSNVKGMRKHHNLIVLEKINLK